MQTLALSSPTTAAREVSVLETEPTAEPGYEIEIAGDATCHFDTIETIRAAILRGEVPRTSRIRGVDVSEGGETGCAPEWTTVEEWARSHDALRCLYAPIWSLSRKGALAGLIVVGILKALDTLVTLSSINPLAAFLWLLVGAAIFSPKWKLHFAAASFFFAIKSGASLAGLWGAWMGVGIFAAAFGSTAGMAIGTVVGFLRANSLEKAPDAASEGSKASLLGLALPLGLFVVAVVLYVQVFIPALLESLQQ